MLKKAALRLFLLLRHLFNQGGVTFKQLGGIFIQHLAQTTTQAIKLHR